MRDAQSLHRNMHMALEMLAHIFFPALEHKETDSTRESLNRLLIG